MDYNKKIFFEHVLKWGDFEMFLKCSCSTLGKWQISTQETSKDSIFGQLVRSSKFSFVFRFWINMIFSYFCVNKIILVNLSCEMHL